MAPSEGRISRREFLWVSVALPVCLAIPIRKGSAAEVNEHLAPARPGYGSGVYGSGPYGSGGHNLYLPAVYKKGE